MKFLQQARFYDYRGQSKQALPFYLAANKYLVTLLKSHPDHPFLNVWARELKLGQDRINQLKLRVADSPPRLLTNSSTGFASNTRGNASDENREKEKALSKEDQQRAELEEEILRCQIKRDPFLSWKNIIGHQQVIHHLRTIIELPLKQTDLVAFRDKIPRAIMLYGPPGCAKTFLIRVLAAQIQIPIYSLSAATLMSKWQGESQKMVRAAYETAHKYSPSVIFFDEFDGVFGRSPRSSRGYQSPVSQTTNQMQHELQQYMDEIFTPRYDNNVVTIVATNYPWHFQSAQLRRFDRVMYIPPPDSDMIDSYLTKFFRKFQHVLSPKEMYRVKQMLYHCTIDEVERFCASVRMQTYRDNPVRSTAPRDLTYQDFLDCEELIKPLLYPGEEIAFSLKQYHAFNEKYGRLTIRYMYPWWDFSD
ncbi:MAG: AAA family ATPase [Candidatus Hodarchaeales archaeon]|jgi:SpoVK/Ycf46/Vps4 family AAA+-type ATPase